MCPGDGPAVPGQVFALAAELASRFFPPAIDMIPRCVEPRPLEPVAVDVEVEPLDGPAGVQVVADLRLPLVEKILILAVIAGVALVAVAQVDRPAHLTHVQRVETRMEQALPMRRLDLLEPGHQAVRRHVRVQGHRRGQSAIHGLVQILPVAMEHKQILEGFGAAHVTLPVAGVRRVGYEERFQPTRVFQEGREERDATFTQRELAHLLHADAPNQLLLLQGGQHAWIGDGCGPTAGPGALRDGGEDFTLERADQACNIPVPQRRLHDCRSAASPPGRFRNPHVRGQGAACATRQADSARAPPGASKDHRPHASHFNRMVRAASCFVQALEQPRTRLGGAGVEPG